MERKFKRWFVYWFASFILLVIIFIAVFARYDWKEMQKPDGAIPVWIKYLILFLGLAAASGMLELFKFRFDRRRNEDRYEFHKSKALCVQPAIVPFSYPVNTVVYYK